MGPTRTISTRIGAIPVVYGEGMADRVRALNVERIDAVLDAVGKTPIEGSDQPCP